LGESVAKGQRQKMSTQEQTKPIKEQVEEVLERLRPMLMADGGNIELVDVKDDEVFVQLVGACGMCPSSTMTLKMGVERAVREAIPSIKRVTQI
jgi:Fe-S cluster biogenesis protein NfuA